MSSTIVSVGYPPISSRDDLRKAPTAPEMTCMHFAWQKARRWMVSPTMYSSPWKRPKAELRFATLTFPPTASTVGSWSECTRCATVSGRKIESASMHTTIEPSA